MPKNLLYRLLPVMTLLFLCRTSPAQRVLINTYTNLYQITGGIDNCTYTDLGLPCLIAHDFQSIALHKDTLYAISMLGDVYQADLNSPGACNYLTNLKR